MEDGRRQEEVEPLHLSTFDCFKSFGQSHSVTNYCQMPIFVIRHPFRADLLPNDDEAFVSIGIIWTTPPSLPIESTADC